MKKTIITKEYILEKVEAYNLAIQCLRNHESASEENIELSKKLRLKLANKLDKEIQKWVNRLK